MTGATYTCICGKTLVLDDDYNEDGKLESRGWALVKTNGRWHYMCPKCRGKE